MYKIIRIALFTTFDFAAERVFLWAGKRKLNALTQRRYDLKTKSLPTYKEVQKSKGSERRKERIGVVLRHSNNPIRARDVK
jgi:hypothetical protein